MDTGKQLNANELIAKLQELEKENARLRKILDVHGIPYIVTEPNVTTKESLQAIFHTDSKLSLQEKVALFRSVFKVVMISLPSVGTVVRLKSQATNKSEDKKFLHYKKSPIPLEHIIIISIFAAIHLPCNISSYCGARGFAYIRDRVLHPRHPAARRAPLPPTIRNGTMSD